jgi:archaellum component FlaC
MGLFSFIKNLFSKVEKIEAQAEVLVNEVAPALPKATAEKVKSEVKKVKAATATAKTKVEKAEQKVSEVKAAVKKTSAKKNTK